MLMPIIKKHETLADFVATQMGTMNAMFLVANANGGSITEDYQPGQNLQLVVAEELAQINPVVITPFVQITRDQMLKKHQNNTDFVCQHFGSMASLFSMAQLNGISITETPVPGTPYLVQVANKEVVNYYLKSNLSISSKNDFKILPLRGIGYMRISIGVSESQNDFIVS
jgi:hypothetical protein